MEILHTIREELNAKKVIKTLFGIDARALGIYRIALAICLLVDLAIRAQDIRAFYTDEGVVPSDMVAFLGFGRFFWTLHTWATTYIDVVLLMALAAIFALLLLVGYRTRLMAVLSWIMLLSLQNRNLLIWQGCDELLRLMMFWGMLLPLNAHYAIDNIRRKATYKSGIVLNGATAGILIQVAYLYLFTAILKSDYEWGLQGNALWYALNLDEFAKPPAHFLLHYPDILPLLGFLTLRMEYLIPILFFLPVFNQESRIIGIVMLIVLHISFALCLLVGPFPFFNIMVSLVFIPPIVWNAFERLFAKLKKGRKASGDILLEEVIELSDSETHRIFNKAISYFAILVSIYTLYWNFTTVPQYHIKMPKKLENAGQFIGVEQQWDMFAPYPLLDDCWYVMPAIKRNGDTVDLWRNGAPLSWKKPEYVASEYKNFRWQKFMRRIMDTNYTDEYKVLLPYLTHTWNETHVDSSQHIKEATLYIMLERTRPPGIPMKVEKKLILTNIVGKGRRKKLIFSNH